MKNEEELIIIPKCESYIEYMLNLIMKLPRTEKYSIGTEYKISMYETLEKVLYINKIESNKRLYYLNLIDTKLNLQRIYLRIMKNNRWINEEKFQISIDKIGELGKILFNLKQEEYIKWLLQKLKNGTYKHGGYTTFYITEPKLGKIEESIFG